MAYYVLAQPAAPLFMFTKLLQHIFPLEPPVSLTGCEEDSACKTLHGGPALMAYNHVQPRVAAAENMRYEESKRTQASKRRRPSFMMARYIPLEHSVAKMLLSRSVFAWRH